MERKINLFEDRKNGFECHAINTKTGRYVTTKKWHYFKNGISLCSKYQLGKYKQLMPRMMYNNEICKECLMKLKEVK